MHRQLLARHARHQHPREVRGTAARPRCSRSAGGERRADQAAGRSAAVEQLLARLGDVERLGRAARAGRAPRRRASRSVSANWSCSSCARSTHGTPSNSSSSLLRGVSRRSSRPGRCRTTVAQPPDLAPDAVLVAAVPRRVGDMVLLGFLIRRLFFAVFALVVLAVIVYIMFDVPHRLERVFFHLDFGVSCSYPGCPAVTKLWGRTWQRRRLPAARRSRARRHDGHRRRGVLRRRTRARSPRARSRRSR